MYKKTAFHRSPGSGLAQPLRKAWLAGVLSLLLAPMVLAAQTGSITGRVVTADDEPVTDATVTVVATQASTEVDADGRFTLEDVPAGEQILEVVSKLHARGVDRIEVAAGESTEIELLVRSRTHSERIVVTATPDPRGELDLAAPVNVLEGRELATQVEPSLGETLANEPGISTSSFAPGASRPIIRGLGGDRVKVMENGLDTLDASAASPDHAVASDPLLAQRVEVLRGPATLLYGSNAIGGVVNIIDDRVPSAPPSKPFTGTIDLRGGTVADERAAAASLSGGNARWAWHVDGLTRETDNYEIPGHAALEEEEEDEGHDEEEEEAFGILPNSDIETRSGGLGLTGFFGNRGYLGVAYRGFDTEYGVPGGEHGHHEEEGHDDEGHDDEEGHGDDDDHGEGEEEEEEEDIRIDMRQRRFDIEGGITQPFGAFRGAKLRLGIVDYEHDELEGPDEIGTRFFNEAWEGRFELVQKRRGNHTGSFGLQVRSRDLEAIGEEAFIPPAESENIGLFTFQEIDRGALSYQFGLRYEVQDTTVREPGLPDRDFDALSASLGLVWKPSGRYSLGASVARSAKMPTGEELYSNGAHFATSAFEIGDTSLEEETSLGLDLTLRRVEGRVTGAFNLFYNDFSDYIFQAFTGDEEDELPVLLWSQADANFWGAELDLSILLAQSAHASWDLDLLWDFVRAEFDDGGDLPRIPPQRFGVGLHYRGDRLRAGANVRFVDEQDRISANETPTDSYTLVSADVGYRFLFASSFLDLILRGTNLTDEEARVHTSFVKDSVPLPGRNVSLIARLRF